MAKRIFSNIIGFDDAPFAKTHRGNVPVVGAVYAGLRLDGMVIGRVRRDGNNATKSLSAMIGSSRFSQHIQLVMLQGISLAGFNVIDVPALSRRLDLPVLVVARYAPDMGAIRQALLTHVSNGAQKWRLIEKMGPMEPVANVFVQRVGLTRPQAQQVVDHFAVHGRIPEPLRTAHLFAGALGSGQSRGRT